MAIRNAIPHPLLCYQTLEKITPRTNPSLGWLVENWNWTPPHDTEVEAVPKQMPSDDDEYDCLIQNMIYKKE